MKPRLLWFAPERFQQLANYALECAPNEACGVLIGAVTHDGIANVEQIVVVNNIAPNPRVTFRLDDVHLARIIGGISVSSQEIVGFFHSHPRGDSIPSEIDVRLASYPDAPQVIVGLGGRRPAIGAWRIAYGAVSRVKIVVSDTTPTPPPPSLSSFQKSLILVSALLALLLVITWALALLPPAPEIPR